MMPFLGSKHNDLMSNLIYRGYSTQIKGKFWNFIYDKHKFINPIYVFLDHNFQWEDDFCINSTLLKVNEGVTYLVFN